MDTCDVRVSKLTDCSGQLIPDTTLSFSSTLDSLAITGPYIREYLVSGRAERVTDRTTANFWKPY
jgi:hypothetical protein